MGVEHIVNGVSLAAVSEVNSAEYDALVLVTSPGCAPPGALAEAVRAARELDAGLDDAPALLRCGSVAGARLVLAPTGPLTPYHDVRSVGEAARAGLQRAMAAGARRPALVLQPHPLWPDADLVALLGALEALYVPLEVRESFPERGHKVQALGVYGEGLSGSLEDLLRDAAGLERARAVARDLGGADPERMTPLRAAEYIRGVFAESSVRVRVLDDRATLEREYPLLAAVNRAAASVERHRGCVVYLEYEPASYERTVLLVGKGVTYDTGGCDLKVGGVMAGMSRDKCGAATVAGFLKACDELRPALKVGAVLGMVRNSVGEEAYVADELLRSRRGLGVRVGNTDAEGRMVMADLLAEMAERAEGERAPHLYTVATLTGHAGRAYGPYTAAMDNHAAAWGGGHARALAAAGERVGDMLEVSRIRREDLATHRGRGAGDALHQAGSLPSSAQARGHQAPAAFLLLAAGLDAGRTPYTHLDVAASAGEPPHQPTAASLLALAAHYGLLAKR
ncbi:unnamed protein product [Chrysodeixis includens]|uniref:Cytosol aminopeptidase domain-containing protein n=1 Tax=Chrysodeixis includens TaxID=689277 RepID=A0A9P0BUE1_CHRIL|nr:unnamed protein product [Chrysodeixis includens]